MTPFPRIEELRRRVQKDPASLVFAQLAEEHRRAGELQEAVRVCRAGLRHHPEYHSARVTLGRALLMLGELDAAARELGAVLQAAPENLAACRGLGEIHYRSGRHQEALERFRRALVLAPGDAELLEYVAELESLVPAEPPEPREATAPIAVVHAGGAEPLAAAPIPAVTEEPGAIAAPAASGATPTTLLAELERWHGALVSRRPTAAGPEPDPSGT